MWEGNSVEKIKLHGKARERSVVAAERAFESDGHGQKKKSAKMDQRRDETNLNRSTISCGSEENAVRRSTEMGVVDLPEAPHVRTTAQSDPRLGLNRGGRPLAQGKAPGTIHLVKVESRPALEKQQTRGKKKRRRPERRAKHA